MPPAHRARGYLRCAVAILALHAGCTARDPGDGKDPALDAQSSSIVVRPAACSNLALAATITAQSTYPNEGYSVAHIHDGDRSTTLGGATSWANASTFAANGVLPNWVNVDFGSAQTVSEIDLYTSAGYEIKDYDIQVLSGGAFTTVASVRGNRALMIATPIATVVTSQVRILAIHGPDVQPQHARINELEVLNCAAATTRISGNVHSFQGRNLPGIAIEAGGATTTTDANGNYSLLGLPYGQYTVHASGGGYTFGSAQFQIDHDTVALSAGAPNAGLNIVGYNHNPVVYVHGWTDDRSRFIPHPSSELTTAGYAPFYADLETSIAWTPPFETNVSHVTGAISDAKYQTGQSKVILFSHSMGGLVARTYLETSRYNNDVSQYFSFGSPHLGTPAIVSLACLPNQPGVCEMTSLGMTLFNLTHWKRSGVDYHEVGGDAPLWTTKDLFCFRFFGHHWCVSIPWPDTTFRNAGGWAMGILIGGPDDGLIGTCSAIGQPGTGIDRFVTQEVHTDGLGPRSYFDWGSGVSQQAYANCVSKLLVTNTATTCGTRGLVAWGCVASGGLFPSLFARSTSLAAPSVLAVPDATSVLTPRAAPQSGQITVGQAATRTVVVEGGGTTFSLNVQSGSAALSLIDPVGTVINPAYVASVTGGTASDPDAELTTTVPSDAVTYDSTAGTARYYFPNARPGTWTVNLVGNSDLPSGGSPFTAEVTFDSTFTASFHPSAAFVAPGSTASFSLQLPSVASAAVTISVTLPTGAVVPLTASGSAGSYTASFAVPSTPGYARVSWSVVGQRGDGVSFERGGYDNLQITSPELTWGGVGAEATVARSNDASLAQALVLQARVNSTFAGAGELAADLVNASGAAVAHVAQPINFAVGANTIALSFTGDDIYASALDGPYTLTNLYVMDTRVATILAASVTGAYTTAAYKAALFAPAHGAPSVTTSGPYTMYTGDTLALAARGTDPESQALMYAWDLDNNGSYETAGQTVSYTAPASTQASTITVGVRATDPNGNTATAQTTIDISPNREVNLALQATASASSTFSGYAASHVNDNNPSTALGGATSWANDSTFACTGSVCGQSGLLPATLDLDFGATHTLTHATLYTTDSYPIQDYDLEIWDGTGWNVLDRVRGNTQAVITHTFAPVTGSKVRVVGYTGPAFQTLFVRVNELQVFGY
jgi:pimeloyl-ACP methyl ester carboxylesterase